MTGSWGTTRERPERTDGPEGTILWEVRRPVDPADGRRGPLGPDEEARVDRLVERPDGIWFEVSRERGEQGRVTALLGPFATVEEALDAAPDTLVVGGRDEVVVADLPPRLLPPGVGPSTPAVVRDSLDDEGGAEDDGEEVPEWPDPELVLEQGERLCGWTTGDDFSYPGGDQTVILLRWQGRHYIWDDCWGLTECGPFLDDWEAVEVFTRDRVPDGMVDPIVVLRQRIEEYQDEHGLEIDPGVVPDVLLFPSPDQDFHVWGVNEGSGVLCPHDVVDRIWEERILPELEPGDDA
ncbi:MAG: hypothetical protein D6683_06645 [Actinomyces sp.]|nr:MAG: hypothetical protein D6683_06645 [Actinomyces sp.]